MTVVRFNPALPPKLCGGFVVASRGVLLAAVVAFLVSVQPAKAESASEGCGVSTDTGPEQVFQAEPALRTVASYSRDMQAVAQVDLSQLDAIATSDLHGSGLEETIRAFRANDSTEHHSKSANLFLSFWKDDSQAGYESAADSSSLAIEAAVAANAAGTQVGGGNVLIPLPPAAVSGLSVMGGLSLMAGIRRVFKR